jgi:FixJ family two-component response regulator
MPRRDGLWLTAELRKRYLTTAIVLATQVSTVAPQISMQAGVLAYLVKPFRQESVIHALEAALAWHTDMRSSRQAPRGVHGRGRPQ